MTQLDTIFLKLRSKLDRQIKLSSGFEAKVWQQIEQEQITSVSMRFHRQWSVAMLVLVFLAGGLVGAIAEPQNATLIAFTKTPAYSVMTLIEN